MTGTVLVDRFCLSKDQNIKPYFIDGSNKASHITETAIDSTVQLVLTTLDYDAVIELERAESINVKDGDELYSVHISEITKLEDRNGVYIITISGLVNDINRVVVESVVSKKDPKYERLLEDYQLVAKDRDKTKRDLEQLRESFNNLYRDKILLEMQLSSTDHERYRMYKGCKY